MLTNNETNIWAVFDKTKEAKDWEKDNKNQANYFYFKP